MSMKERIQHIVRAESLTNLQFAQLLDISPAAVTHLLSGRNNPSLDIVVKIARKLPHYNLRWLLLGEGTVYNGEVASRTKAQPNLFAGESATESQSVETPEPTVAKNVSNDTHSESCANNKSDAAEPQKLIVCLPDGTFREYTKQG